MIGAGRRHASAQQQFELSSPARHRGEVLPRARTPLRPLLKDWPDRDEMAASGATAVTPPPRRHRNPLTPLSCWQRMYLARCTPNLHQPSPAGLLVGGKGDIRPRTAGPDRSRRHCWGVPLEQEDRMTAKKHFKSLVRRRAAKTGESYTAALRHFRPNRQEEPPVGAMKAATANCSFCGKPNTEVRKIVAGPGVKICDQCVTLCNEVIAEVDDAPDSVRRSREPSTERLLKWLPAIADTLRSVEGDIAQKVSELRQHDVPWTRIAQALRMSESEAMARFRSPT